VLLDTSTIVEIFRNPSRSPLLEQITAEIGDEGAYISIIQLAEVAEWAERNRSPPEERIDAVKELARVVPLDERICLDAAQIKAKRRKARFASFGLVDGVILATARSLDQRVLTFDGDFGGIDDCVVLKLPTSADDRGEARHPWNEDGASARVAVRHIERWDRNLKHDFGDDSIVTG
jgi:predicted nucleic acid-binding protein